MTSGTVNFRPTRWQGGGMRYLKFARFLTELHETAGPFGVVYYEEVRRHLGVDAAHAYGGFLAHLTAWCEKRGIPYEGVPVGTIKKHATGRGNATKAQVLEAVRQHGYRPEDDNEADALALMLWVFENIVQGVKN
ncbi:MAG: hypothetical protein V6Z82_06145 [Flavobacteriales bacterium]